MHVINVFVDFYQNFSLESKWSANKVMQFYQNIKSTKIKKTLRRLLINEIVYFFAQLGFGIAEYNDRPRPIMEKEKMGGSVPENGRKSRKMKPIVPDLSEKIMACVLFPNDKILARSKLKAFADDKDC